MADAIQPSEKSKTRGRPRSEASREAILIAALTILVRDGYQKLTIEGVAREAGTGKSTIYRWWDGRSDLAIDAFFSAVDETLDLQDTGSAEADFRAQILGMANQLRGPTGRAFAAMLAGGRDSLGRSSKCLGRTKPCGRALCAGLGEKRHITWLVF